MQPFFFAESTITGAVYLDMLQNWLWPQPTEDIPQDLIHFQQDGAPPHYHWEVQYFLDDQLPGCWVGSTAPIAWSLRSPGLNPLGFFWGYVKEHVYISASTKNNS
jgi:hypothetical protein